MKASYKIFIAVLIALGSLLVWNLIGQEKADIAGENGPVNSLSEGYNNAEYEIEGKKVKLSEGFAETETVPGSASKTITRYFGNELKADLDGNGLEDVVFLLIQETGGSGVFFYVVAALNTKNGYVGSDGYFLGDRIAPQSTELSQNPEHDRVVVVNYADRLPGEPMSAEPSVGKSAYLKIDPESKTWEVVISNPGK